MRDGLKYAGIFVVSAVLMQLMVFDAMHLWIYFNPLVYVAFLVLLPLDTKPIVMLALGLATGVFMDFFEGTGGLHTIVALFTAFARRYAIIVTMGRDAPEEGAMPSFRSVGERVFMRYSGLVVGVHCVLFFVLEGLSGSNFWPVMLRTAVSGVVTLPAVWAVTLLFTYKTPGKA